MDDRSIHRLDFCLSKVRGCRQNGGMEYPIAPNDCDATNRLLQRVAAGETDCLGDLLVRHRARVKRMVAVRLDARLAGRLDPSDVV